MTSITTSLVCLLCLIYVPKGCYGQDINEPPVFRQGRDMDNHGVPEDTQVGSEVYQLEGVDLEERPVTFGIQSNAFEIRDPSSGRVYLTRKIDYEKETSIPAQVSISDGVNVVRRDITVRVIDVNDNPPLFSRSSYSTTVPEDAGNNTVLFQDFVVQDVDTVNEALSVSCDASNNLYGDACSFFRVVAMAGDARELRGDLVTNGGLDYEKKRFYTVPIQAYDGKHSTLMLFQVNVTNVADSGPIFTGSLETTIDEGLPPGREVIQVKAVSTDSSGAGIVYEWASNPGNAFTIDRNTGMIRTNIKIDRELPLFSDGFVLVRVFARQLVNGVPGNTDQTTALADVRINIRDMNDNPPTITPGTATIRIKEDIANGAQLPIEFLIRDIDQGANANFEIFLGNYQNIFEVRPRTGSGVARAYILVRNTDLIDYDRGVREYVLQIVARESSTVERYEATANLTIQVEDVFDRLPYFEKSSYTGSVLETAPGGTSIITIAANAESAQGLNLVYSIIGNGADKFYVNPLTGLVTVASCNLPGRERCIDYEQQQQYRLTFQASDRDSGDVLITVPLIINVLDANDNGPEFSRDRFEGYISEGERNPSPQIKVTATDADSGGQIVYSIVAGNRGGIWQIDRFTGIITATEVVDYGKTPNRQGYFLLTVQATDGIYRKTAEVLIYVVDKNDHTPVFNPSYYETAVSETTAAGTVVETVRATDLDPSTSGNGRITYRIISGDAGTWVIDEVTGAIRLAAGARLRASQVSQYRLVVVAADQGTPSRSATATVVLNIRESGTTCPYFQPRTVRLNVYENVTVEQIVGRMQVVQSGANSDLAFQFIEPIRALDRDGRPIDPASLPFKDIFRVEEDTGYILVGRKVDQNRISQITYTVQVRDKTTNTVNCENGTLRIDIKDVNDLPPYFIPPWTVKNPIYFVDSNEEQPFDTYVTTMVAVDPDGFIERYEIFYSPGDHFLLNSKTGVVTIVKPLDYEAFQSTQIVVHAIDNGNPPQTATATVNVNVININDINPQFNQSEYAAKIPEHSPRGTYITTVRARDRDYDDFGKIRYTLDNERRFSINNVTGVVRVQDPKALDRERASKISITVTAYDSPAKENENVRRYTTVPIFVELTDINDNDPKFSQSIYYATLVESLLEGSFVTQLVATDLDFGINATITYSKQGDAQGIFLVNANNGTITTTRRLKGLAGEYTFNVTATDGGGRRDTAIVNVTILKANNAPPEWIDPIDNNQAFYIVENTRNKTVTKVKAKDPDLGINGKVRYYFFYEGQLVSETPEFKINMDTGVITMNKDFLDREAREIYTLVLVARDSGTPALESTRYIVIQVRDQDDNGPSFPLNKQCCDSLNGGNSDFCCTSTYHYRVLENTGRGLVLGEVRAVDPDKKPYNQFYYTITSGNDDGSFTIDQETGQIRLNKSLDYEAAAVREIVVEAKPKGNQPNIVGQVCGCDMANRVRVRISVVDVNDNAPKFDSNLYSACVSKDAAYGKRVTQVSATDRDLTSTNKLEYRISSGKIMPGNQEADQYNNEFVIGQYDGVVYTNAMMVDYEGHYFDLDIQADDRSPLNQDTNTKLYVYVTNATHEVTVTIRERPDIAQGDVSELIQWVRTHTNGSIVCYTVTGAIGPNGQKWTAVKIQVIDGATKIQWVGKRVYELLWGTNLTGVAKNEHGRTFLSRFSINDITGAEAREWGLWWINPVLALMIVLLILLFLAFLCLCCWCCMTLCNTRTSRYAGAHTPIDIKTVHRKDFETQELQMNVPGQYYQFENHAFEGEGMASAKIKEVSAMEGVDAALLGLGAGAGAGAAGAGQTWTTKEEMTKEYRTEYSSAAQRDRVDGTGTLITTRDERFNTITRDAGTGDDMLVTTGYPAKGGIGATLSASATELYPGSVHNTYHTSQYQYDQGSLHGSVAASLPADMGRHRSTTLVEDRWDMASHLSSPPMMPPAYSAFDRVDYHQGGSLARSVPIHSMSDRHLSTSTQSSYIQGGNAIPVLKVTDHETIPVTDQGVYQGEILVRSRPQSRASNLSGGLQLSPTGQVVPVFNDYAGDQYSSQTGLLGGGGQTSSQEYRTVTQEYSSSSYQR